MYLNFKHFLNTEEGKRYFQSHYEGKELAKFINRLNADKLSDYDHDTLDECALEVLLEYGDYCCGNSFPDTDSMASGGSIEIIEFGGKYYFWDAESGEDPYVYDSLEEAFGDGAAMFECSSGSSLYSSHHTEEVILKIIQEKRLYSGNQIPQKEDHLIINNQIFIRENKAWTKADKVRYVSQAEFRISENYHKSPEEFITEVMSSGIKSVEGKEDCFFINGVKYVV